MLLEDISIVLQPQLYRSNWAPEFSEDTVHLQMVFQFHTGYQFHLSIWKQQRPQVEIFQIQRTTNCNPQIHLSKVLELLMRDKQHLLMKLNYK